AGLARLDLPSRELPREAAFLHTALDEQNLAVLHDDGGRDRWPHLVRTHSETSKASNTGGKICCSGMNLVNFDLSIQTTLTFSTTSMFCASPVKYSQRMYSQKT